MKRFLALAAAAITIAAPGAALAYAATAAQNVTLPKGETRTGTYYATGQVVVVDGDIDGDLVCAGQTVTISGAVHGDILCAGQTITVSGPVDGSVRLAGQTLNVNGPVGRNVTAAAQSFTLGTAGAVKGDLGVLGQTVNLTGPVSKDVYGRMETLTLAGLAGGVDVSVNSLTLSSAANVQGNLHYTSQNTFAVDKTRVSGDIKRSEPVRRHEATTADMARAGLATRLYWIFAALAVGLVLAAAAPQFVSRVTDVMLERPGASLGWGLAVALLGPLVAVILMVTVIGVPLGLLLLALWGLSVLLSGILAGVAAGRWFLARAEWRRKSLLWAALLGVPLAVIAYSVPILGALVSLVATWWALGALSLNARALRR